jgi:hypothetical protein
MTDWKTKNDNRRRCHERDPEAYRAGRAARKMYAKGGAFGEDKRWWGVCSLGTTAAPSPLVEAPAA